MLHDHLTAVYDAFGLSGDETGEVAVRCPFHGDTSASASINLERSKYNCHACGKAFSTLHALADALEETDTAAEEPAQMPVVLPAQAAQPVDLESLAFDYLESRGFHDSNLTGVEFEVETDTTSPMYGYLIMRTAGYGDRFVARNLLPNTNPRYFNSTGKKDLFYLDGYDEEAGYIWLVEGIFDALSLRALGYVNVAAVLGSKLSSEAMYQIRDKTVFLLFDRDYAGYSGAKKAAKELHVMKGNPIVVEMEREHGDDPNDAFVRDAASFEAWLREQAVGQARNDVAYIESFLADALPLQLVPTGLPVLDDMLGGGFKDGVIVLGAEPAVGKTSFAAWFAANAASNHGKRVLFITYEVTKRQIWSRIASIRSGAHWATLELNPAMVGVEGRKWLDQVSQLIRVEAGWSVQKILGAIAGYDVVIVDYLQRMPGKPGDDVDEMANVSANIRQLSNIARDHQKIILCISSLNRVGYGAINMSIFKASGDTEYVAQVAMALLRHRAAADEKPEGLIDLHVIKNTRGARGVRVLQSDLGHQTFAEAEPYGGKYQPD